jgi:hypothetical protein
LLRKHSSPFSRTTAPIQHKAQRLGLVRPLRIWSEGEFAAMKPLYVRGAPMAQILERLDDKTKQQVWSKAASRKLRRPRQAPCLTGFPVIDTIRRRAFDLNLSMADLDALVGRRRYFQRPRRLDWAAVQRILPHLGGCADVVWRAR